MLRPLLLLLVLLPLSAVEEPRPAAVLAAHGALLAGPVASGVHAEPAIAAAFHHQLFGADQPRRDHPPAAMRTLVESGGAEDQAVLDRGWYELGMLLGSGLEPVGDRLHRFRLEAMRTAPARARVIGLLRMWRHAPVGPAKARWASLLVGACYWGGFEDARDPISVQDFRHAIAGIGNNPRRLFDGWALDPVPEPQRTHLVQNLWQSTAWLKFDSAPDVVLLRHLRVQDLVDPELRPAMAQALVGKQGRLTALLDHFEQFPEEPPPALRELAVGSPLHALLDAAIGPDEVAVGRVVDGLLADRIAAWDWFGSDGYRDFPAEEAPMASLVQIGTWHRLWRQPAWRAVDAEARLAAVWPALAPATRGALVRVLQPVLAADGPVLTAARTADEPRLRLLAAQLDLERDPDAWRRWCAALLALEPEARRACGLLVRRGLRTLRHRLEGEPEVADAMRAALAACLEDIAELGSHWSSIDLLLRVGEVASLLELEATVETCCFSLAVSDRDHANPWILTRLARALLSARPTGERGPLLARAAELNHLLHAELQARCGDIDVAAAALVELEEGQIGRLPEALEALLMARDFEAYAASSWTHPGLWQPWRGPERPAWGRIGGWTEPGDDDHLLIGSLTRRLADDADRPVPWRKVWTDMHWFDALEALDARDRIRPADRELLAALLARGGLGRLEIRHLARLVEILRSRGGALEIPTVGASDAVLTAAAEVAFQAGRYAEAAELFAALPLLHDRDYGMLLVRCLMAHHLAGIEPPPALGPAALATRRSHAAHRLARWHAGRGEGALARRWMDAVADPDATGFHARCLRWRLDLALGDRAAAEASLAAARRSITHPDQDRYLDTLAALTAAVDDPVVRAWAAGARDDLEPGGDGERGARAAQLVRWSSETGSHALRRQLTVELALIDQAAGRVVEAREAWFELSSGDDWWADLGSRWATALIAPRGRLRRVPEPRPGAALSPWTARFGVELDPAAGPPLARLDGALLVFPDGRPHPIDPPAVAAPYQGWRRVVSGWLPLVEPGAYGLVTRVDGSVECLGVRIASVADDVPAVEAAEGGARPAGGRRVARP